MSPSLFDDDLKERCLHIDIKGLISIAGTFHNTRIDDLYQILQIFNQNQIINHIYTKDDIKDEISFSRYIIYDDQTSIIINY